MWPNWSPPDPLTREAVDRVLGLLAGGKLHPEIAALWSSRWTRAESADEAIRYGVARIRDSNRSLSSSVYLWSVGDLRHGSKL